MSNTEKLKAATGAVAKTDIKNATIASLMADPKIKAQMALALPKHLTADRLARIATTEMRRVPALANCSPESFLGAIMQCAQLGLEPSNGLGQAYLIPFGNGKDKQGRANVQLIIGYRGMIDLARRSGQIVSISARAVYENDEFSYQYGLYEELRHVPAQDGEAGQLTHVYAVAKLKDGGVQFEVMTRKDIEKVRASSSSAKSGSSPWVTHFDEMAKKTVIRRLFKYLPVSIEIQRAAILDEQGENDINQNNAEFFANDIMDGEYTIIEPAEPSSNKKPQPTEAEFNNVLNQITTGELDYNKAQELWHFTDEQQEKLAAL